MTKKPARVLAIDGLPARNQGPYAKGKLEFLDHFIPPALTVAAKKLDRVYLDLFAGPGINKDGSDGAEFDGSPLRSLVWRGRDGRGFSRAIFCNIDGVENAALGARVQKRIASCPPGGPHEIQFVEGDCNAELPRLLKSIHAKAYVLAFADIEGPQDLPWTTVERLVSSGHTSVDLYVLFPLELALNRLTGMNPEHRAKHEATLRAFYGCDDFKPITDAWLTDAQGPAVRDKLERLYRKRLKTLWEHAEMVEVVKLGPNRPLYRMHFATSHDAARRVASWTRGRAKGDQGELPIG